jgi:hypothetical protein
VNIEKKVFVLNYKGTYVPVVFSWKTAYYVLFNMCEENVDKGR